MIARIIKLLRSQKISEDKIDGSAAFLNDLTEGEVSVEYENEKIKSKIRKVIQGTNGFPNHSKREYLNSIRLLLHEEFSNEEVLFIKTQKISLNKLIMEVTKEATEDLF